MKIAHSNIIHVPPVPGRLRNATLPNDRSTTLLVSEAAQDFKTPTQVSFDAGKAISEGSPADSVHQEIAFEVRKKGPPLPEQGWFVKLHFGESWAYRRESSQINAELMAFLTKKGINVELIPEQHFIEYSAYSGKHASGRGI